MSTILCFRWLRVSAASSGNVASARWKILFLSFRWNSCSCICNLHLIWIWIGSRRLCLSLSLFFFLRFNFIFGLRSLYSLSFSPYFKLHVVSTLTEAMGERVELLLNLAFVRNGLCQRQLPDSIRNMRCHRTKLRTLTNRWMARAHFATSITRDKSLVPLLVPH